MPGDLAQADTDGLTYAPAGQVEPALQHCPDALTIVEWGLVRDHGKAVELHRFQQNDSTWALLTECRRN
jgi:hypothetical protein